MGWCDQIADSLAEELGTLLEGRTVACAESCTGGRIGLVLAAAEGSQEWFRGGLTAYQVPVKRSLLNVASPSVYSEDAAAEMANGAAKIFDADITVATTGVLGDEPVDGQDPGTVFIATRIDGRTETSRHRFAGDPAERGDAALCAALDGVVRALRRTTSVTVSTTG